MDTHAPILRGEYLDEFVAALEWLATPLPIRQTGNKHRDDDLWKAQAAEVAFYRHMLDGVRRLGDRSTATLSESVFDDIADSFNQNQSPQSDAEEPNLNADMGVRRAEHYAYVRFTECLALQTGTVQEYIAKKFPLTPAGSITGGAVEAGYNYLTFMASIADAPPSRLSIFRQAEAGALKHRFTQAVAALNPGMGDAALGLQCQEGLASIAQHSKLPLPEARGK